MMKVGKLCCSHSPEVLIDPELPPSDETKHDTMEMIVSNVQRESINQDQAAALVLIALYIAGYTDTDGSDTCKMCEKGTFLADDAKNLSAHDEATDCIQCKLGEYTMQDGATLCLKCLPGKKGVINVSTNTPVCVACTPGFYSESEGEKIVRDVLQTKYPWRKTRFQCKPGKFLNTSVFPPTCFPCGTENTQNLAPNPALM